jgi:hypothetical protein
MHSVSLTQLNAPSAPYCPVNAQRKGDGPSSALPAKLVDQRKAWVHDCMSNAYATIPLALTTGAHVPGLLPATLASAAVSLGLLSTNGHVGACTVIASTTRASPQQATHDQIGHNFWARIVRCCCPVLCPHFTPSVSPLHS